METVSHYDLNVFLVQVMQRIKSLGVGEFAYVHPDHSVHFIKVPLFKANRIPQLRVVESKPKTRINIPEWLWWLLVLGVFIWWLST